VIECKDCGWVPHCVNCDVSLKEHTEENIRALVDKIIDGQIADGLMRNAPLTFKDVETIKNVFVEKLKIMYHTRISYPDLKKGKDS
jgi:cyclic-di-AMP phosphodiesterase PgpH